jgi:hypothetical protein
MREARRHRRFLAEIARQIDDADALVLRLTRQKFRQGAVAAAIVDADIFDGQRRRAATASTSTKKASIAASSLNIATTMESSSAPDMRHVSVRQARHA